MDRRARKLFFAVVVTLCAVLPAGAALAQPAPPPPHQFFGDAGAGSGAAVNGELVPDGTVVTARNEDGLTVGATVIDLGLWLIAVNPDDATQVVFYLNGLQATGPISVVGGKLTELPLNPIVPPHQFFGDAASGSGAVIDGMPAPDGTVVTALDHNGVAYASTTITGGLWLIQVTPVVAQEVSFLLDGFAASLPQAVESGALTAIALSAVTPAASITLQVFPPSTTVGGSVTVQASVQTVTGAPAAGVTVTFTIDRLDLGLFTGGSFVASDVTDGAGLASALFENDGTPGTVTFTATMPAASASATATFAFPKPPHVFFGENNATIDGAPAPDGSLVSAVNQNCVSVGSDTISAGGWAVQVDPDDATQVYFRIGGLTASNRLAVAPGSATAVALGAFTADPTVVLNAFPATVAVNGQSTLVATVGWSGLPAPCLAVEFQVDEPGGIAALGSGPSPMVYDGTDLAGKAGATLHSLGSPGVATVTACHVVSQGEVVFPRNCDTTAVTFTVPAPAAPAPVATAPIGAPDLELAKAALHADPATPGAELAWELTIGNGGNAATSGPIQVVDMLPPGAVFADGAGPGWACVAEGQQVTCTSEESIAAAGGAATLTIRAHLEVTECGEITNTASVSGGGDSGADPDASASASTMVVGCPDLTTDLTPADAEPDADGRPTLTATSSDGTLTVEVRDYPPDAEVVRIQATILQEDATEALIAALDPSDVELLGGTDGVALALDVTVTDSAGEKLPGEVTVVFSPPPDVDLYLVVVFVVGPDGQLAPVPTAVRDDGRVSATIPFDFQIVVPALPPETIMLRSGFTSVAYTGHIGTIGDVLAGTELQAEGVFGVFRFDRTDGYQIYRPSMPALGAVQLRQYDPLFMQVQGTTAIYRQGRLLRLPHRAVELFAGPNMIVYTGTPGRVDDRVDREVRVRADAVWKWSNALQRWLGYFPGGPDGIQGFTRLELGDVVYVSLPERVFWNMR